MISVAMYSHLSGLTALTALVWDRLYNGAFEQDVQFPAVLFSVSDEQFSGNLGAASNTCIASVQIDTCSRELSEAGAMAKTIRGSLETLNGSWQGVTVQWCSVESAREMHQQPVDGSDNWIYRVSTTYTLRYNPTIPPPIPAPLPE